MTKAILAPAAVLILWTLIILVWMGITRFGGVKDIPREKLKELPRSGGRGQDLERVLPAKVTWASHNYTHLHEQPTLFYAVVMILALAGEGAGLNLTLAWAYTGLRIAHSLWQILINQVPIRFALFLASTACLVALAVNAVRATLG